MEGLLSQRVTPLLKCVLLSLFIFTAKVLTSRPQESQDARNSIIHPKTSPHYVRTFTKYHHRRTIQWNNFQDVNNYWPAQDYPKTIEKRSVEDPKSDEFMSSGADILNLNQLNPGSERSNILSFEKQAISASKDGSKNDLFNDVKVKKAREMMKETTTTLGPQISCIYKMHNVVNSKTYDLYKEDPTAQWVTKNEYYDFSKDVKQLIIDGQNVPIQFCMDPMASCFTFYHGSNENITILGQGCWRFSTTDNVSYNKCMRSGVGGLPNTMICHCSYNLCNADFKTFAEEVVTPKAELTMGEELQRPNYPILVALAILTVAAILVMAFIFNNIYCKRRAIDKDDISDEVDIEKGEIMGTGADSLATGLLCVDNLNLIEHIGQGKFGSVWRGSLGSTPVAVKLYHNTSAWQKEAAIYALPHLAHPNLLRYYGSDNRPSLNSGGRRALVVLELCGCSLRERLQREPLEWIEFATLAHGIASALAHLHTPMGNKPCVVHRDVTSSNVLVSGGGVARLADLGLAQALHTSADNGSTRITEAGTLRYLAPEALEGALDLRGARGALCAVDVFALALVLWEALWVTRGAHAPPLQPPYVPPYHHHGLPSDPTLQQMQSMVSRKKLRPPLPGGGARGGVGERALRLASDTCDECWDHDAEARLTAVCVEERMAELKIMLLAQGPVIHDNNLHPHPETDASTPTPIEPDKNSNCVTTQNYDATIPLLYPHPHIGRNACIERNTHTNIQTHTVELIHKSLKDISAPTEVARLQNIEENCLSVARLPQTRLHTLDYDRLNEIRSYQRPLDYVPNDVSTTESDRGPKETNLIHDVKIEKPKWSIRKFFESKMNRNSKILETEVKLIPEINSGQNGRTKTSLVNDKPNNIQYERPSNLLIEQRPYFEGPCTLSPPNRTLSPTMLIESEMNRSENKVFKRLPSEENDQSQVFAVIVPKSKPDYNLDLRSKTSTSRESSDSVKNSVRTSMSSQSFIKAGQSESEDSTVKKRLSCDNKIITNASNSGRSSRASVNLELTFIDHHQNENFNDSPFDLNSDCSSSEDEHLMLLSENGGSKITMQTIPKNEDKKKCQNDVLKESGQKPEFPFNKQLYKYKNFDNEFSDPQDKENLVNGYSVDNPVYMATLGEIPDFKYNNPEKSPKSPKPSLKNLDIKRQHSLEQVSDIFSSSGDLHLLNPAGRVKTPGDLPVAVRRARRDRALQKGRASECTRLSLYDDRMMFGNSL